MKLKDCAQKYKTEFKKLASLARERRLTIFVGAGLSHNLYLLDWEHFLKEASLPETRPIIEGLINKGKFIEAADEVQKDIGYEALAEKIKTEFGDQKIIGKKVEEPFNLLTQFPRTPVVTTNFDCILESVFEAAGKPFDATYIGAAMQDATSALIEDKHVLLKIHGSWNDTANRVLTSEEYRRAYGGTEPSELKLTESLAFLVLELLLMRHILFIGCSLKSDLTVRVAEEIRKRTGVSKHFTFESLPNNPDERKQFLNAAGITPIFFPAGKYGFISLFLRLIQPPVGLAPATQTFFNALGLFTFFLSFYFAVHFQLVMINPPGPLLLLIGLVVLPLCLFAILALAFRHARTSYNTAISGRLVPIFGLKSDASRSRVRWLGWLLYIAFPVTVTVHFWLETWNLKLHQDRADEIGLAAKDMVFPDYFFQGRWDVIFGRATHYWWGIGPGHVHAYPIIQPWLYTILTAVALLGALFYTFCVLTGIGVSRITKILTLKPTTAVTTKDDDPESTSTHG